VIVLVLNAIVTRLTNPRDPATRGRVYRALRFRAPSEA
jgi:hypothetical protein